ncbi:MAG: hypothetical protein Q7J25_10240 [Vicinamibacterales bacterium]|nr:hypothetical protein [Vicinamibacterales bacterium]
MRWKLWKTIRGCKIMRQTRAHQRGEFEYEIFAPDGYHFTDGPVHSMIESDASTAESVARNDRLERCDDDC